jgi:hypothetical protein
MASNDAVGMETGIERHCGERVAFSVVCEASRFASSFPEELNEDGKAGRFAYNAESPLRTTGAYVSERLCFGLRK